MKPRWLSSSIGETDGRKIYRDCQTATGDHVSTGDFVYLLPKDYPNIDLYIGRIESLYEDENAQKCAQVQWFYRPKDLEHDPPSPPLKAEVYYTNYYDCQLIESIAGRCEVVHKEVYMKFKGRYLLKEKVHPCCYAYSADSGSFTPVKAEDLMDVRDEDTQASSQDQANKNKLGDREVVSHGDVFITRELTKILLGIERRVPGELASANWASFKRLPWVLKAKNAMTLNDLKQLLVELDVGLEIFHDANEWRKSVEDVTSFEKLALKIHYFKHNAQKKVNDAYKQLLKTNEKDKGIELLQTNKEQTRKRKVSQTSSDGNNNNQADCNGSKRSKNIVISAGSAYEIDHRELPPATPAHLQAIRVILVTDLSEETVTLRYPSITSLIKYFGRNCSLADKITRRSGPGEPRTVIGTKPILDDEFVVPKNVAEKALKRMISCTEYLHQGHLQHFWMYSNLHISLNGSEVAQVKRSQMNSPCNGLPETVLSPLSQAILNKADNSEKKTPNISNLYNHKLGRTEQGFKDECKDSMQTWNSTVVSVSHAPPSIIPPDCVPLLPPPIQCSEENIGLIRWGVRKKVTYHSRSHGNASSFDKESTSEDDAHSQERNHPHSTSKGQLIDAEHRQPTAAKGRISILRVPRDMQGRWSKERYKAAQLKLLDIMHDKGAVPGRPILRPALREEARKHIGDTGLLDHLLKHMTDTVVSNGERFRRRHNSEGAMEYWLEDAKLAEIRKQAGVEDPCWIPPPGWKPGDAIPMNSFYGVITEMSPSQAEEMEKLKEDVNKLKSQMQSLIEEMEKSLVVSRLGDGPSEETWEKFEEHINDQTKEMRENLFHLREALENCQSCPKTSMPQSELAIDCSQEMLLKSEDNNLKRGMPADVARREIQGCIEKIENKLKELAENAASEYKTLLDEKLLIETQLKDLQKAVAAMQEDVNLILRSVSEPQSMLLLPPCETSSTALIPLTHDANKDPPRTKSTPKVKDSDPISKLHINTQTHGDNDDILLFQKAAQVSFQGATSSACPLTLESKDTENPCLFAEKENILLLEEEHDHCGFRVCKPQGSFLWPYSGKDSCLAFDSMTEKESISTMKAITDAICMSMYFHDKSCSDIVPIKSDDKPGSVLKSCSNAVPSPESSKGFGCTSLSPDDNKNNDHETLCLASIGQNATVSQAFKLEQHDVGKSRRSTSIEPSLGSNLETEDATTRKATTTSEYHLVSKSIDQLLPQQTVEGLELVCTESSVPMDSSCRKSQPFLTLSQVRPDASLELTTTSLAMVSDLDLPRELPQAPFTCLPLGSLNWWNGGAVPAASPKSQQDQASSISSFHQCNAAMVAPFAHDTNDHQAMATSSGFKRSIHHQFRADDLLHNDDQVTATPLPCSYKRDQRGQANNDHGHKMSFRQVPAVALGRSWHHTGSPTIATGDNPNGILGSADARNH